MDFSFSLKLGKEKVSRVQIFTFLKVMGLVLGVESYVYLVRELRNATIETNWILTAVGSEAQW